MAKGQLMFVVAGLMIVLAGGALVYMKDHQRLGEPGVRVADVSIEDEEGNRVGDTSVYLPEVDGFNSKAMKIQSVVYEWLPKDTVYGRRVYQAGDGFWLECNVVLMGADRTSIHQPQYCLPGSGWQIVADEENSLRIGKRKLPVNRIVARKALEAKHGTASNVSVVMLYFFVTKGEWTADHNERMWRQAVEQLTTGVLQRWAYVACFALCHEGREDATTERLLQFLSQAAPEFVELP